MAVIVLENTVLVSNIGVECLKVVTVVLAAVSVNLVILEYAVFRRVTPNGRPVNFTLILKESRIGDNILFNKCALATEQEYSVAALFVKSVVSYNNICAGEIFTLFNIVFATIINIIGIVF